MDVAADLERFIVTELATDETETQLSHDEDLLDRGLIDSAGIVQLIAYLEERYGLQVTDDELVPENFRTIEDLARFVSSKTDGQS